MSYQNGEAEPERPDVAEVEIQLAQFQTAIHDLYVASLPEGVAPRWAAGGPDAPFGVAEVARSLGRQGEVDRLFKLHAVASALTRKPALADSPDERAGLAEAILPDDESDGRTGDLLAERLQAFALRARDRPSGLTPARWRDFVGTIEEPDDPARAVSLVGKPGCNDEEIVPTPSGHATTIRSRFWTHLPLAEASQFIDPQCWTIYGRPFWKRMAMVEGSHEPFHTSTCDGYTAVFEEVVELPLMGEVQVYLWVEYKRSADHVSVDYRLADSPYPNEQVTFDSGWLYATSPTTGPHGEATYVDGLKSIRFRDPQYNEFPDLACDGGWVHFMINMALAGAGLPGGTHTVGPGTVPPPAGVTDPAAGRPSGAARPGSGHPGPAPPGEVLDGVGRLLDEWARDLSSTLQVQVGAMTTAVGRVLGPRPDPRWVNDLLGMGQTAIATTERSVATWRRILAELARMGGER